MPIKLVDHPGAVIMDPDQPQWTVRMKYTKVSDLLEDYRASNASLGRVHCPVTDYLAEHVDDDILAVEEHIYSHPDWGPAVICESWHRTLLFNNARSHPHGEFLARWAQHYLALQLRRHHPFAQARPALEPTLKDARMRFVSPEAAYVVLAYLNAGHPNPRKFLEKPEVARHFPGIDVSRFKAPDFD